MTEGLLSMMLGLFTFMLYLLTIYLSFVSGLGSIHMHVIQCRYLPKYVILQCTSISICIPLHKCKHAVATSCLKYYIRYFFTMLDWSSNKFVLGTFLHPRYRFVNVHNSNMTYNCSMQINKKSIHMLPIYNDK